LRSLERIAGELFESVSLLASGSISFELVDAITTLENSVKQLEQENAHVNGVVAAQAKELEDSKRAFNKKTKKLERAKKTWRSKLLPLRRTLRSMIILLHFLQVGRKRRRRRKRMDMKITLRRLWLQVLEQ
jgi:hypothetical protein